jgi:hypothetical protein
MKTETNKKNDDSPPSESLFVSQCVAHLPSTLYNQMHYKAVFLIKGTFL